MYSSSYLINEVCRLNFKNYNVKYIAGVATLEVNDSRIPIFAYAKESHSYVITSASPRVAVWPCLVYNFK